MGNEIRKQIFRSLRNSKYNKFMPSPLSVSPSLAVVSVKLRNNIFFKKLMRINTLWHSYEILVEKSEKKGNKQPKNSYFPIFKCARVTNSSLDFSLLSENPEKHSMTSIFRYFSLHCSESTHCYFLFVSLHY